MKELLLGKHVSYETTYNPELLTSVSRLQTRNDIGIGDTLSFQGVDIWNAWELSWLNLKGKPVVASASIKYSAESTHLVESKSLKLYLNSFNQSKFQSREQVIAKIKDDLTKIVNSEVDVIIYLANDNWPVIEEQTGICLDDLDVEINKYDLYPDYLLDAINPDADNHSEQLYSHLFKSNCMVTGQPDWASIFIEYTGKPIKQTSLLKYLISFRNHQAFHEPCVEKIFVDLMKYCKPESLSVYCRYTRRGGLDINPFRSTNDIVPSNNRIWRQ